MFKRSIAAIVTTLFVLNLGVLAYGAKPSKKAPKKDPVRAMIIKIMQKKTDDIQAMIDKGVKINAHDAVSGITPLVMASMHGRLEIAQLLVKNGADVNLAAKNGTTPLIAAASKSLELVKFLLEKGADPAARTQEDEGAFTYAIVGAMGDRVSLEVAEILLEKGAMVDETPRYGHTSGYTPLMMASARGKLDLVKFLVKHGANVNAATPDGSTPMSLAKDKKQKKVIKFLKKKGAKQ